jgi:arsenate reductase-like glutaredoxin family protein
VASTPSVTFFWAHGCSLCEKARAVLDGEGVVYEAVEITGDPLLEETYREWLPVVEIDGKRAFVYFVDANSLRRKLSKASQT